MGRVSGADPGISDRAKEILGSIDFYKVGHHGSTNATPIPAVAALNKGAPRCVPRRPGPTAIRQENGSTSDRVDGSPGSGLPYGWFVATGSLPATRSPIRRPGRTPGVARRLYHSRETVYRLYPQPVSNTAGWFDLRAISSESLSSARETWVFESAVRWLCAGFQVHIPGCRNMSVTC